MVSVNVTLFLTAHGCHSFSLQHPLCHKLAILQSVEVDLCAAIDLKLPLSRRVQLMSRLLRNEFSWLSVRNDVEPL